MKTALAAVMAAFLFMGATCSSITPDSVAAEITKDCGLVVTVADIAALLSQSPNVASAAALAKQVCDAFHNQPPTASRKAPGASGVLVVDGVPLHYTVQ